MLEAQMLTELHKGKTSMLNSLISLLDNRDFFEETDKAGDQPGPFRWLLEPEGQRADLKKRGVALLMRF